MHEMSLQQRNKLITHLPTFAFQTCYNNDSYVLFLFATYEINLGLGLGNNNGMIIIMEISS